MKNLFFILTFFVFFPFYGADTPDISSWTVVQKGPDLLVTFRIPGGYYAYADKTDVRLPDQSATFRKPEPTGEGHYTGPGEFSWICPLGEVRTPCRILVTWQLCRIKENGGLCLMPQNGELTFGETLRENPSAGPGKNPAAGSPLPSFRIIRSAEGYMPADRFLAFLSGESGFQHFSFAEKGVLMSLVLAILGGIALNLTPCVLPLIPVNLAILGTGTNSALSRKDRIIRGLLYGGGIACTYGLLGVLAVLTGTTFGTVSASWLFHYAAALIFMLLGLSMFGIFNFDLSAAAGKIRRPSAARRTGVFLLGAFSAVLAGACVAPVIAAALLQASGMAASGNYAGLFLPFLVGCGMALPWPFLAAGITLLPRPGAWMNHVKHILGILILLLALYYLWLGTDLLRQKGKDFDGMIPGERLNTELSSILHTGKPILLDFGASWCKNCTVMESVTLKDPQVRQALAHVHTVKIRVEDPLAPEASALLKTFNISGFPAFVLIQGL